MRILYLDLDTLRADHLGCYGYHRNTSPNIDHIAKQGVRFENYYCSDAPCLPSRTALMTGRFGFHTGVVGHGGSCADMRIQGAERGFTSELSKNSLPAFLKEQGIYTTFIGGFGERHSAWSFYAGFREIHDTGKYGMESAEDVTPTALDWIERNAKKDNWYLHINYWDAHGPYRAPDNFGNPFQNDPLPSWLTPEILDEHRKLAGPHTPQDLGMYHNRVDPRYPRYLGELKNMDDVRRMIDGYDCGVSYMDTHIGRVFDALKEKGVLDDLAIIISADHGENLGELGIYVEHGTADYITCRVPLIIRWRGCKKGYVDTGFHYNLDLAPTLAELFGKPPRKAWDGQSFAPAILDGAECGRSHLIISQCAHVCQRGVRWRDWMYIKTWHDGYHLFPDEMLFNIREDPHEQKNLASYNPDQCREGAAFLEKWLNDMLETMPPGYDADPMETVLSEGGPFHARGHLKEYCKRLEETGRSYAIAELKNKHPREFE
ncbi:sulfatase [Candidatus Sumerlaeota bacterium]|nr:sulfatase [Candidatus Sumerlaeota bacterium]